MRGAVANGLRAQGNKDPDGAQALPALSVKGRKQPQV